MNPTTQKSLQEELSSSEEQHLLLLQGGAGGAERGSRILEIVEHSFHRGCNNCDGSPTLGLVHMLKVLLDQEVDVNADILRTIVRQLKLKALPKRNSISASLVLAGSTLQLHGDLEEDIRAIVLGGFNHIKRSKETYDPETWNEFREEIIPCGSAEMKLLAKIFAQYIEKIDGRPLNDFDF